MLLVIFFVLFHLFEFSHRSEAHTEYSSYIYKTKLNKIWEGQGINCPFNNVVSKETGSACSLESSEDLFLFRAVSYHLSTVV